MNGTDQAPATAGGPPSRLRLRRERPSDGESLPADMRHLILIALRTRGALSPERLATEIGASRTGVLQQLRALELAGLVDRQTVRHGVGRPRHLYDVTPKAQAAMPTSYRPLVENLLAAVDAVGGEPLVGQVFEARRAVLRQRIVERFAERLPAGASIEDRVRELAVIQDEQGYLGRAVIGDDGSIRLCEHNCAVLQVAGKFPAACQAELELFRDVLGADVVRETHIAAGDRACTYRIRPGTAD